MAAAKVNRNIHLLSCLLVSAALLVRPFVAQGLADGDAKASPQNTAPSPAEVAPHSNLLSVPLPDKTLVTITMPAPKHLPSAWQKLPPQIVREVQKTHADFTKRFGPLPTFELSIRLIDTGTFTALTGAAHWVEAMVYNGQMLLPLPTTGAVDSGNILRSVRHEYTHAVIAALTAGRCIAWLNEGLAQLEEGAVDPELFSALSRRLQAAPPLEFTKLRSSFRALPAKELAAAYAQALLAAAQLERRHGAAALRRYFDALRAGEDPEAAFAGAFGVGLSEFEAAAKELLMERDRLPSSILVR